MSVIDEIKQRADIVEIVSDYVPLQKAGRSFKALCPFHTEKHPSFFVFPERQSWHCFGSCGTGGDVFAFIMKKENADFGEALQILARRTGIAIPQKKEDETEEKERERLRQINAMAAQHHHHTLLSSPQAEVARSYLARRGISTKSIEDFQLGFSLDSWKALCHHLTERGYEEQELAAAGLVVQKDEGGIYDRFRNRLMFPIADTQSRVIGFGARALDDSLPKYLNSPQTAIFDKSSIVYGIDRAKMSIRRQGLATIVEGYTDVIIAHQHGFDNVVASMGTSLTEKQVNTLKRLTKNLALALDADAAGDEATLRGVEVATRAFDQKVVPVPTWRGMVRYENILDAEIKIIALPRGMDPDEVIRESKQTWQSLVEESVPMIDYIFTSVSDKLDLTKAKDKSSAVEQLLPIIAEMKDPVRQSHYLQKLARMVKVDERTLDAGIKRARYTKGKREVDKAGQKSSHPASPPSFTSPVEEFCLSRLLQNPELKSCSERLLPDYFDHIGNRELFIAWRDTPDLELLKERLDITLQEHLTSLIEKVLPPADRKEQEYALADCILRLREKFLKGLKTEEQLSALEASSQNEVAQLAKLQEQGLELPTQLREVFIEQSSQPRIVQKE